MGIKLNQKISLVIPTVFLVLVSTCFPINANAAIGGINTTQSPCITKGNITAQINSLKSARKISYCVQLTGNLSIVIGNFTWDQAKSDAILRGGKITGVRNSAEQAFLDTWLWNYGGCGSYCYYHLWTAGRFVTKQNTWIWDDTSQVFSYGNIETSNFSTVPNVYSNWANGEPNYPGTENCVEINPDQISWPPYTSFWNNLPCSWTLQGYLIRLQ